MSGLSSPPRTPATERGPGSGPEDDRGTGADGGHPGGRSAAEGAPAGFSRWFADLMMGARFTLVGGRESWFRTGLTIIGVGLGVAVLLLATAVPHIMSARDGRESAQQPTFSAEELRPSDTTALYAWTNTEFRGKEISGRLMQPDGSRPPLPPGVSRVPAPGEMVVSPALAELLESSGSVLLKERLPYRITGTIGKAGLGDPYDLVYYAGSDSLDTSGLSPTRIESFGQDDPGEALGPLLVLLIVVACAVLLMPVGAFVATAVRFGGERRDRRLAALRLVGADIRMTHRIAAGEALIGALLGLLAGAAMFLVVRQFLGSVQIWGTGVLPSDVRPVPLLVALIVLSVPTLAVGITLLAMRGIAVEPLGVVRHSGVRRRRLWWRLVPPVLGLLALLSTIGGFRPGDDNASFTLVAVGIVLVLIGVAAVLPWLVEAVVRRLSGGPLPWQLAIRRLQLDSGSAARAVSGITIAVAGAIAVQMLFGGVSDDYTKDTGQDTTRAQMMAYGSAADGSRALEMTEAFAKTRGVREVLSVIEFYAPASGSAQEEGVPEHPVTIGDCDSLKQLARIDRCADGDVFLVNAVSDYELPAEERAEPGMTLDSNAPDYRGKGESSVLWTIPDNARTVTYRTDPVGYETFGVFATPGAGIDVAKVSSADVRSMVRIDESVPDAMEYVRNTGARLGQDVRVLTMKERSVESEYAAIQRGLYIGAVVVMLLIGASLIVSIVEQLRERKRLLSVLVAFGTRRSTMAWSVLWQTAVPVVLGLAISAAAGLGLGSVLLRMAEQPVSVDWVSLGILTGIGATVIGLVTLASLPALWRMMRPDGLRTE